MKHLGAWAGLVGDPWGWSSHAERTAREEPGPEVGGAQGGGTCCPGLTKLWASGC